jgi:hypothetical protein
MANWLSERLKDVINFDGMIEFITAGKTCDANRDNGKTFILADAAPGTITLPAVTNAGFKCTVIVGSVGITDDGILASAEGDNMEGSLVVAGAAVTVDAADQINFVDTAENIGDRVDVISDGVLWYVSGVGLTSGSITATG